jgi:hypothetical protein
MLASSLPNFLDWSDYNQAKQISITPHLERFQEKCVLVTSS